MQRFARVFALLAFGAVLATAGTAAAQGRGKQTPEDWNDAQIAWKGYDAGLALAKRKHKPVCLIFYTEWCPHCRSFSGVFHDSRVVEEAKKFVMIRLNKDQNSEISHKYAPDGEYIPRTYFLSSNGKISDIKARTDQYAYFYDEHDPGSVLGSMYNAARQLK
jgi:thiol-disulfide isomerase/thioredoxin